MESIGFTVSCAVSYLFCRSLVITFDRKIYGNKKNDFNWTICFNTFLHFFISAVAVLFFGHLTKYFNLLLKENVICHGLLAATLGFGFAEALQRTRAIYSIVTAKFAELIAATICIMHIGDCPSSAWISIISSLLIVPFLFSLNFREFSWRSIRLIAGSMIIQSQINYFFYAPVHFEFGSMVEYIGAILTWRLLFTMLLAPPSTFFSSGSGDNFTFDLIVRAFCGYGAQISFYLAIWDTSQFLGWSIVCLWPLVAIFIARLLRDDFKDTREVET